MKKIFFILVLFIGFYAGADSLKVMEVKDGMATIKVPEGQTLSVNQMLYTENIEESDKNKLKRNGFVSSSFGVVYSFDADNFVLNITTAYGEVMGESDIAEAGIFEGSAAVSGRFSEKFNDVSVSTSTEINFMKNDGINKLIPGLQINIFLGYVDTDSGGSYVSAVGGGIYLKAFVSKQFALMPYLGIVYAQAHTDNAYLISGRGLALGGGVSLRRYF